MQHGSTHSSVSTSPQGTRLGMLDGASHSRGDVFFTSTRGGKCSTMEKPTFREDIAYFQFLYIILTSLALKRAGPRKNRGPDAKDRRFSTRHPYGDFPALTFAAPTLHPAFGTAGGTHVTSRIFPPKSCTAQGRRRLRAVDSTYGLRLRRFRRRWNDLGEPRTTHVHATTAYARIGDHLNPR